MNEDGKGFRFDLICLSCLLFSDHDAQRSECNQSLSLSFKPIIAQRRCVFSSCSLQNHARCESACFNELRKCMLFCALSFDCLSFHLRYCAREQRTPNIEHNRSIVCAFRNSQCERISLHFLHSSSQSLTLLMMIVIELRR